MSLLSMFGMGTRSLLTEGKLLTGKITAVSQCWWLKVNTKAVRIPGNDGAVYPHIIRVSYVVDGVEYTARRWLNHTVVPPVVGETVALLCDSGDPRRCAVDMAQFGLRL